MQESIVIICLTLAFVYVMYTFFQKIRRKGGGCCGCSKDCGKIYGSSAAQHLHEINTLQVHDKK